MGWTLDGPDYGMPRGKVIPDPAWRRYGLSGNRPSGLQRTLRLIHELISNNYEKTIRHFFSGNRGHYCENKSIRKFPFPGRIGHVRHYATH